MRLTVDPLDRLVVWGGPPQWPHTWDMAVRTMRMAPRGQRAAWPGAAHLLVTAQAGQVQQPAGNNKDCGVCALMSALGTLLRVPRPGNLLSTLDRRWVAAVVLNKDMGPMARLPSLGELPAAVLDALPAPRAPLDVADVPHNVGLPGARMQHALLCMAAAADGGMSMLMTVSLQHVQDAMQQQQMHAPQPWEESAKRWLQVESVPPTHTVGMADMGRLVVLEGAEYWACVWVETAGLEWVVVTACRLRRQQSRGPACYRVFRECLRELGPVRRAHRCTAGDIPQAPAVFVEVTRPPKVQGQDVSPVAPSNIWQAQQAAVMCRALQGQAAALPRAPAAQSSSNRPAAWIALLHNGSRAWCWVVVALEPHSSALRLYDRGEGTVLTVRPADLEALHLGALSGDGGTALYLQGTVVGSAAMRFRRQSGGDALRLVLAENMGPWLRAFSTPRWKVEGDREKFADAWRRWVEEQFPIPGGDAAPAATTRRAAGSACGTSGRCGEAGSKGSAQAATQEEPLTSIWQLCQHTVRAAALQRRPSHGAPGIEGDQRLPLVSTGWSWPLLVVSRQALPARPPPTSTPGTSWTTFSGTMGLIQLNGTRR